VRLATLGDLDQRSAAARAAAAFRAAVETDLGGDLSAAQSALVIRLAMLATYCEHCEARWLGGEPFPDDYLPACNVLNPTARALGLKRVPKPVESLAEYAARMGYGVDR
jgi:hypothetical protein